MPEITEETLQAWAQLADYTDSHGSLDARVALHAAIAEIRRLRGEIAALVEAAQVVLKFRHPNDCTTEWARLHATIASLSEAAAARDKRLKAEGAAEALRPLPCTCRAVGNNSEDAAVITCLRCRALAFYEAEAARLGGVA